MLVNMYSDAHLPTHWPAAVKPKWYIHTHTACVKCLSPPASTPLSTVWDDRVDSSYMLRHTSVSSTFTQSQLWGLGNLSFHGRDKGSPSMRTLRFSGHIYKGLGLGVHWKDWCWSWNSNTLATSCEELIHWKRPWCWEGLGAGGEGDNRGWDGWMVSPTRWAWVWVNSGSWWWTGRPGVLRFMGSQRVRHDWATELNWTEAPSVCYHCHPSACFFLMGLLFCTVSHWGSRFLYVSLHMKVLITWTAILLPEKLVEITGFSLAGTCFL